MIFLAGVVVALGALVQGAVGYGMALVAVPLLVLVDPTLVPVPLLLLTSMHSVLAVFRDGRHVDWSGVGWAMLGYIPGTGLGVLAVLAVPQQVFSLLVGLLVLVCVVLSLLTWRPRPRPGLLLFAGVVSGAGGTAAGIGGPPIVLLYQNETGPRVRGTISSYFMLGAVISIAALAVAGQVTSEALWRSASLIPFLVTGFALSGLAHRVLDNGRTRHAVLTVSTASAVLLIGHALL
jgi:uncharacterized membrane protein YfcA